MADENIRLNVVVNGEEQIKDLAASVRSLIAVDKDALRLTKDMDARQRALGKAFGVTTKGIGEHAKSLREVRANQKILRQESARLSSSIKTVNTNVKKLTREGNRPAAKEAKEFARQLKVVKRSLDSVRPKALTNDLKSMSLAIKKMGKDAQFVGRSLIIGLTTPLIGFANKGIDAFKALDREMVRLKKIAGPVIEDYDKLGKTILDMSAKFGVSQDLIAGVTADFAELGISTEETLVGLTDLTNQVAVLGTMDVSDSQGLLQTMFLGTIRSMDLMGRTFESSAEKQAAALASVTAQMFVFNAVENNTALSFRDMAISIPEATAATTAFGLTMTQTAALLAPMKAAGIDVSTAANGLKVSLQRLVTPTGVLNTEMDRLLTKFSDSADVLGPAFENIQGTGMGSIQGLVDATKELRGVASDETVLQFYAKLFQKRQATRMLTSIDSLISFQDELFNSTSKGTQGVRDFVNELNKSATAAGAMNGVMLPAVDNIESFTFIARIGNAQVGDMIEGVGRVTQGHIDAANQARGTMREYVKDIEQNSEDGMQIVDQISSQAGKALFVELLGAANAAELAQQELDVALGSASKALDKAKIGFKNLAVSVLSSAKPAFIALGNTMTDIAAKFENMSDGTKRVILAIGALVAGIGPLVFIVGQMQLAFGVVAGTLLKFVPSMAALTAESLVATPAMLRLNNAVTLQSGAFTTAAGRFQRYIATLASGSGVTAKLASGFGRFTRILNKNITAPADVVSAVQDPATAAGDRLRDKIREGMHGAVVDFNEGAATASQTIKNGSEEAKDDMIKGGLGAARSMEAGAKKAALIMAAAHRGDFVKPIKTMQAQGQKSIGQLALPAAGQTANQLYSIPKGHRTFGSAIPMGAVPPAAVPVSIIPKPTTPVTKTDLGGGLFKNTRGSAAGAKSLGGAVAGSMKDGFKSLPQALKLAFAPMIGVVSKFGIAAGDKLTAVVSKSAIAAGGKFSALFGKVVQSRFMFISVMIFKQLASPLIKILGPVARLIKSFGLLGKSLKVLKMGFAVFTGGILIGAIAALTPFIMAVVKNFDEFRTKIAPGIELLGKAFASIKVILEMIMQPVRGLFDAISGGSGESDKVQMVADAFNSIAEFVHKALMAVRSFVSDTVVPFMEKAFGAVVTLVGGFKNIVKAAIDMKNGVAGAGDRMKDALKQVGRGILEFFLGTVAPGIVSAFAELVKLSFKILLQLAINFPKITASMISLLVQFLPVALKIFKALVTNSIKVLGKILKGIGQILNKALGLFTDFVRMVIDKLGPIANFFASVFGVNAALSAVDTVGTALEGLGNAASFAMDAAADAVGGFIDIVISAVERIDLGEITELGDSLSESIAEALDGTDTDFNNFIDGLRDEINQALKEFEPTPVGGRMAEEIAGGAKEELENNGDEIFEPVIESSNEAGGAAGDAFADKFNDALKSLKQKFVDLVEDALGERISDVVSDLTDALQNQRDSALAAFDEQLDALDKMEKAEESLTRTREFELNMRKLQDERELNRQNYVRNRALAIYEGRIDDARMLDREEQKSRSDSANSISDLQEKRNKDLRKENLNFLKDSIKDAKKEADAFFKEQINAFKEATKDITKFAPQTIEDYESQLTQLKDLATVFGEENAAEFAKTFGKMQDTIATDMPNKVVGTFGEDMDALVELAKEKYGLVDDTVGLVGATSDVLSEIDQIIRDNGPQAALEEAIENAEETILNEWRGTVGHIISEVDDLANLMDPMIANILEAQMAFEALEEAARSANQEVGRSPGDKFNPQPLINDYAAADMNIVVNASVAEIVSDKTMIPKEIPKGAMFYRNGGIVPSFANGGRMRSFAPGGYMTPGFGSTPIPAMLHGGEFVLNRQAVQNIGMTAAMLTSLNKARFRSPGGIGGGYSSGVVNNTTSTTNIYVENFIGEDEWFNSMVKQYDMKVGPMKDKQYNMENRFYTTYKGASY